MGLGQLMTAEQTKIVNRCAAMLRLAFHGGRSGKVVFRLGYDNEPVRWEYATYGSNDSQTVTADSSLTDSRD